MRAILALETGHIFYGQAIGICDVSVGEVIFNTAITGYQEILTDPSYAHQIITFTAPHIGNTGINFDDNESKKIFARGLVVREMSFIASNWRATSTLNDFLKQHQVTGICNIDTRALTKLLRDNGALNGCIMSRNINSKRALKLAQEFPGLQAKNLTEISANQYSYTIGLEQRIKQNHLVILDFGIKQSIIDYFINQQCKITILPGNTRFSEIINLNPDGIILSNGPGDPAACDKIISTVKLLIKKAIPLLGICLGCQLLALAMGARTFKMKFGHHGANHPIQGDDHKVMITSQNHSFAIDDSSVPADCRVNYRSLFDQSIQGIQHAYKPIFGFQSHPEGGPGPKDSIKIFNNFMQCINNITEISPCQKEMI